MNASKQEKLFDFSIITRDLIAKWYGLSKSGLGARIRKIGFKIENRVLSIKDVLKIFELLGLPPFCPAEILVTILTFSHLSDT